MLGVDRGSGVALFLSEMEVALELGDPLEVADDVAGLDPDFLHANTIRPEFGHPVGKALGRGRAKAVEVEAGEFEHEVIPDG